MWGGASLCDVDSRKSQKILFLVLTLGHSPYFFHFQPEDQIQTRIIGGSEVNPSDNRYPYFVSMRGVGICGGVLITPSIAISAAHVSDGKLL